MSLMPRRQEKRLANERCILEAAVKVFSETGFSGTTMDAIAAQSGLSKPTLYQYFESKEQLFAQMLVKRRDDMLFAFDISAEDGMVQQLYAFAWRYADIVMSPEFLSLARLIIGEAQRFPEIGRAYQAAGPDRVLQGLMTHLNEYRTTSLLEFDDPELAAQDLWGLILSAPRTQALHRPDDLPDRAMLSRYINNGLKVFLKAYSTRPASDIATLEVLAKQAAGGNLKKRKKLASIKDKNAN